MDVIKIGKTISFLRKRVGYTQKDLADRIGISDKAVSKWERGLGLPDIAYLRKLSILLNTDVDSLLSGDVVNHDSSWQGIVIFNSNSYRIGASTIIYDKPLVYFMLSYFLLVGIRDILVVCSDEDKKYLDETLGDGSEYGIKLKKYAGTLQDAVKSYIPTSTNIMLIYGRCLLYGVDQTRFFQKAMIDRNHLTVLALPKKSRHSSKRVIMDVDKKIINANQDEPLRTQYDYSEIPILLFPAELISEIAKDTNISSFVEMYTSQKEMYVEMLDRGFVEFEIDDWNGVLEASNFMKIIQERCGMKVYCLEEVAWRRGLITIEQLRQHGEKNKGTEYGEYILGLYNRTQR